MVIDDILIDSRSEEGMTGHLSSVLQTLEDHKLYVKFSKCELWLNSISFHGHMVSSEGIKVDFQKIEVVRSWPRPTAPTKVQSFLGVAGYYRRFVEGFPLFLFTKLTQNSTKF